MNVKTLTITTISVTLLAATAIGAGAQKAPSIGAVTAATGTEGEGTWTDGDMFVQDGAHLYGNGLMDAPVHFSDPRLPETWHDELHWADLGVEGEDEARATMWWGTSESRDDVGAWSGTTQGVTYIDGSADGPLIVSGSGGYEGLSAILDIDTDTEGHGSWTGSIPEGPLPIQ